MKVVLYQQDRVGTSTFDDFLDVYFNNRMEYFASDLLDVGLSPMDINIALKRAVLAAKTAGFEVRHHFHHQYSDYRGTTISDCKLSRLGYGLLLVNANVEIQAVANWQVQLVQKFLSDSASWQ